MNPTTDNDTVLPFDFAPPLWVDETTSTNDLIKEALAGGALRSGLVVAARRQTRGKGRMGNTWIALPDRDLTFSFFWEGAIALPATGTLPMACALGVRDFLALPEIGVASWCKWPNDVLTRTGKICGILAETQPADAGKSRLIVGIGVNLAAGGRRTADAEKSTDSVEEATGTRHDPRAVLPPLLACLSRRIGQWEKHGFDGIRDDFLSGFQGIGKKASIRTGNGIVSGIIHGVGDGGELLLARSDGTIMTVASAASLDFPARA